MTNIPLPYKTVNGETAFEQRQGGTVTERASSISKNISNLGVPKFQIGPSVAVRHKFSKGDQYQKRISVNIESQERAGAQKTKTFTNRTREAVSDWVRFRPEDDDWLGENIRVFFFYSWLNRQLLALRAIIITVLSHRPLWLCVTLFLPESLFKMYIKSLKVKLSFNSGS